MFTMKPITELIGKTVVQDIQIDDRTLLLTIETDFMGSQSEPYSMSF